MIDVIKKCLLDNIYTNRLPVTLRNDLQTQLADLTALLKRTINYGKTNQLLAFITDVIVNFLSTFLGNITLDQRRQFRVSLSFPK